VFSVGSVLYHFTEVSNKENGNVIMYKYAGFFGPNVVAI
jgi:hypothetical protein